MWESSKLCAGIWGGISISFLWDRAPWEQAAAAAGAICQSSVLARRGAACTAPAIAAGQQADHHHLEDSAPVLLVLCCFSWQEWLRGWAPKGYFLLHRKQPNSIAPGQCQLQTALCPPGDCFPSTGSLFFFSCYFVSAQAPTEGKTGNGKAERHRRDEAEQSKDWCRLNLGKNTVCTKVSATRKPLVFQGSVSALNIISL